MGGSYKQCPECGKRALSIATRCPGCGSELTAPAVVDRSPAPQLGRFLSPRGAAGAVAVAVVLAVRLGGTPDSEPSATVADSLAVSSEVAYATPAASRHDTAGAATAAGSAGELLVARTWTNVRTARSTRADLEAVLVPGDTVLADSLAQGWYRVALLGEVLGYAHRSTLTVPGAGSDSMHHEP